MKITLTIDLPEPDDAPLTIDDVVHNLDLALGEIVYLFKQKCRAVIEEESGKVWETVSKESVYRRCP